MTRTLAAALLGVAALATTAHAEQPRELAEAAAAAAAGDWARVEQLVAPLQAVPIALADRAEAERLSGLAAYFQGRLAPAEEHFLAFLRIDPDGSLDPALYPPEALAFLEGVKTRHRAEITARRPRGRRYWLLSLLPPVAQFQNGDRAKGFVLGGLLGAFVVGNVTTFAVLHSWCDPSGASVTCDDHGNHAHAATELRTANYLFGIGALATFAYGMYDGVHRYRERSRELALQPFASSSEHANVFGIAGSF